MKENDLTVVAEFLLQQEIKQFESVVKETLTDYVRSQNHESIFLEDMYEAGYLKTYLICKRGDRPFFECAFNKVYDQFIEIDIDPIIGNKYKVCKKK